MRRRQRPADGSVVPVAGYVRPGTRPANASCRTQPRSAMVARLTLAMLPRLIIFLLAQRSKVAGVTAGGVE